MTSKLLHLHGVFAGGSTRRSSAPAHRIIALPAFNALVSDYNLDPDTAKVSPDDLADAAMSHHQILQAYCADHALLPMRFGTVFSGVTALKDAMRRDRTRSVHALHALADLREYSVEVLVSGTAALAPSVPDNGRRFLSDRKRLRDVRRNTSKDRQTFAMDLLQRIELLTTLPLHNGTAKPDKLLDLTALLSAAALETLRRLAADADARATELGLTLRIRGPWPAYHFDPDAMVQEAMCHGA